jgi:hypothetical protein
LLGDEGAPSVNIGERLGLGFNLMDVGDSPKYLSGTPNSYAPLSMREMKSSSIESCDLLRGSGEVCLLRGGADLGN